MKHNLVANKNNAIAFYRTAYPGEPAKAVDLCVGPGYIQHNPLAANGEAAFIGYVDEDGKIVEHWDSIQDVPRETRNGNTIY